MGTSLYLVFLLGFVFFYNYQANLFENNLYDAINRNKPNLLQDYSVATFEEHDIELLTEKGLYTSFVELPYEWETLSNSTKNIQSIDIEKINSSHENRFPFIAKYTCYKMTFNNNMFTKMIVCTEQYFNSLKINHIYYDHRLID